MRQVNAPVDLGISRIPDRRQGAGIEREFLQVHFDSCPPRGSTRASVTSHDFPSSRKGLLDRGGSVEPGGKLLRVELRLSGDWVRIAGDGCLVAGHEAASTRNLV